MIKAKLLLALSLMVSSASFASAATTASPELGCAGAQPYKKICEKYEAYVFPSNDLTTYLLNARQRGVAAQVEAPARIAYNILIQIRKQQASKDWVYGQNQEMKKLFVKVKKSKTLKAILKKNKKVKTTFDKVNDEFYAYSHILDHFTDDEEDDIEDHDDIDHDDTDDSSEEDDIDDSSEEDDLDDSSEEDDSDDTEQDDFDDSNESDDSDDEDEEDDFEADDL